MYVRLTCKLAESMEGVELAAYAEGDIIDLTEREASLLLRGGWAERVDEEFVRRVPGVPHSIAAEKP